MQKQRLPRLFQRNLPARVVRSVGNTESWILLVIIYPLVIFSGLSDPIVASPRSPKENSDVHCFFSTPVFRHSDCSLLSRIARRVRQSCNHITLLIPFLPAAFGATPRLNESEVL